MKTSHFFIIILLSFSCLSTVAAEKNSYDSKNYYLEQSINEWIQENNSNKIEYFSIANKTPTFKEKLSLAWSVSDLLSVNFNIFENQSTYLNYQNDSNSNQINKFKNFSKLLLANPAGTNLNDSLNRNVIGYKLGLSSKLGFGNDYKLQINLDYGLIDGADLTGFNTNEVNITTFGLGIRKAKFGAKLNTDIFIDDNADYLNNSRLGLELDWHFSDDTVFSVGSKQHINNDSYLNQSNTLDNLTGNVQYIKFQHNL